MNIDYVKKLIVELGFAPQDGTSGVFVKRYAAYNNYPLFVDFNEQKIEYAHQSVQQDKRIRLGDLTTSNFENPENFVVLECVDRLLTKGYHPERLELEKKYPLGRNLKGKLDILVYSENDDSPFLMIECKTWGSEFEKESAKTLKDGGQIFSYYQQDRAAKFLCVYASRLDKKKIEYRNNIILVEESWHDLSSAKDIHDYWNKNFKDNGIFEEYATLYDIKPKALTYGMLKNLKEEDSGKIYNQIMEILRHNAISDKPNAFNKLLNLFVCKIIDENKNPNDELEFQWLETDTDESLQMRLNDLYKDGMWRFLEIRVIDHSEDDVTKALEGIDNAIQKQRLMNMFRDARLKKSPNFAFVEVLDEKTFKLNAKIVREIVELLQAYKFRYEQKHEFLGNFFELLLNTSMKQEAGQFFTPVPITRFIISSLPLKEFVQGKIDSRERNVLPAVMDYACGSGHFLTEYMDQMQTVIDSKIDLSAALPNVRNTIQSWQGLTKFLWAKDSVYGIDLDNRLVKTTKVSAFFNGDGEANIIWANGLDNFEKTEEYRDLLRQTQPYDRKNNGQFDILISNPPYSVEAFKSTLKYGEETFELYNNVTDNSSEIECLFVERLKQLLKVGGWAGVILPSSILSNGGIHSKAREIIFKYFKVKAIVELGSGTFMKTGTNTVVLFLERRSDNDFVAIEKAINTFVSNLKDVTVLGIENAFSKFVANVYNDLAFADYLSFIGGKVSETMQKHELYLDCAKAFGGDIYPRAIELEKEKILYFLLTYPQNIVLVKTGQKQEEKNFLGYEFSERRGHEGIKHLPNGTKLFDENGDLLNPQKANSYIYNAFLGNTVSVDESLARNVSYGRMSGFINYGTSKFDKTVSLNKKTNIDSLYPLKRLSELVSIVKGVTYPKDKQVYDISETVILTADNITSSNTLDIVKQIYLDGSFKPNKTKKLCADDIFICFSSGSKEHVGKCAYINSDMPYYAGGFMGILRKATHDVNMKYLWAILSSAAVRGIISQSSNGANINNLSNSLGELAIPLPPLDVQKQIVAEIEGIENQIRENTVTIEQLNTRLKNNEYFSFETSRIRDLSVLVKRGKSAKYGNAPIQIIKSGQARGYCDFDFTQRHFVSDDFIADERNLRKGDLLINSTGVGTAGRVTLFDLDGDFVVDSHITIVRLDTVKALPKYAMYALANIGFKTIESMANGQSGQIELPLETINNIAIPLPPISRQQEIVEEIERVETEIKAIQVKLTELKTAKEEVLQRYL
ncbi:MAG: N-6 DNA methylase [Clostridiales bacterium]|jgi:type I restriction enzyme M protein|nr:N-6 DNA methylase [Clostridiales bacterium]